MIKQSIILERIQKNDRRLKNDMADHYSQPGGFVGRSLCYAVLYDGKYYGSIVGGSATLHLPNRNAWHMLNGECSLDEIIGNVFFHVEGPYPVRNFTQKVLKNYRIRSSVDWFVKYGNIAKYHETLVELPRTGETYKRDGWFCIGKTKGFTCKRVAGNGTDSWGGARVWDRENLRPKLYFVRDGSYA